MADVPLSYLETAQEMIRDLLLEFECQPILFVGSGVSRRYFSAPDWRELLYSISKKLPDGEDKFRYLCQKLNNNNIQVGTEISNEIFEWAWVQGKSQFPKSLFEPSRKKDAFFKYLVSEHIKNITPNYEDVSEDFKI